MADVEFTRAWKEHEKEEMRIKLEEVFEHFPEFDGKTVKIGRTQARGKRGVYPSKARKNDRRYVRVRPGAAKHTLAHEFIHVLTREKVVDILSLARSPDLIDTGISYLRIEEDEARNNREELHKLAVQARERFSENKQMVDWFEEQLESMDIDRAEEREFGRY